ncbi:MAG: response regulator [bacterium]
MAGTLVLHTSPITQKEGFALLNHANIAVSLQREETLTAFLATQPTFTPVKVINDALDLRLTHTSYWLQLDIDNQSNQSLWFIDMSGSLSRQVKLYIGEWVSVNDSAMLSSNNMRHHHVEHYQAQTILNRARSIKYALSLSPHKRYRLYFHIQDHHTPLIIDSRLYDSATFLDKVSLFYPLYGVVLGGLVTLALYNLLYFFYLRDSSFLALSIFIFSFLIEMGNHSGLWYYFSWTRDYLSLTGHSAAFIAISAAIFIACHWLNLKAYLPTTALLARIMLGVSLSFIPIHLYWEMGTVFAGLLALSLLVSFFIVFIIRFKQGFRFNLSQNIAVFLVLLAFVPTLLRGAGLIDNVPLLSDGMYFVLLLALILLSLTQAEQVRINSERAERKAASTQAKDEFLTTMSHELRTPMNAVVNAGRLLQRTSLDKVQTNYVSRLNLSSQHMLTLINDILDLARLDSHLLQLESTPFHLTKDVLMPAKQLLQAQAEKKQLYLWLDNQSQLTDQYIIGDPTRLRQILINLLNNAIKFTEQGEVQLSIKQQAVYQPPIGHQQNHCSLTFLVRDTGIGISTEQQAQLFKPFSQVDSSISRQYGGSGLGLAICQKLVQSMGGVLTLESQLHQGSCFLFTLEFPLAEIKPQLIFSQQTSHLVDVAVNTETTSQQNKEAAVLNTEPPMALAKYLILLVDDDEMNRFFGRELLASLGVRIELAESGEQALEKLRSQVFDLVFMDISMPKMDGYETTQQIRQALQQTKLPIIALTAHAIAGERERCLQAGMNDYLTKPFDLEQLEQMLVTTLSPTGT